jgi:uncharacterized protein
MALKTERFEMRLEEDILERVDSWRVGQPDLPSRAEAMRRLLELGLERSSSQSLKLSDGEKLLAIMMGDVYKQLKIVNGNVDADFISDAIVGGHSWAPMWEMSAFFHSVEDDPRDVRFVVDVLRMWDSIENSYENLPKKDRARIEKEANPFGQRVKFAGFDNHDELNYLTIARFLIDKMNRFVRFKDRRLDTAMPTIVTYKKMLEVFTPIRPSLVGHGLNAAQIISILQAGNY